MVYKVEWTGPAVADLEAIINDLSRLGEQSAYRFGESIFEHVEVLHSFPRIGPLYLRDRRRRIREITCGKYRIFYRVIEDQARVEILAMRHGSRRDPDPSHLLDRLD